MFFSRGYTNKQQGNTNLGKGFSRVVAHTHILTLIENVDNARVLPFTAQKSIYLS